MRIPVELRVMAYLAFTPLTWQALMWLGSLVRFAGWFVLTSVFPSSMPHVLWFR